MCVSATRVWSCVALPAQWLLPVLHTVEDVLSLLDQYPHIGEGAALTRRTVASAHTVAAHASALLQQTIVTSCSRVRRCELTARLLPVHSAQ
jgi:hypothetical protein